MKKKVVKEHGGIHFLIPVKNRRIGYYGNRPYGKRMEKTKLILKTAQEEIVLTLGFMAYSSFPSVF